jgi:hypothetical protein
LPRFLRPETLIVGYLRATALRTVATCEGEPCCFTLASAFLARFFVSIGYFRCFLSANELLFSRLRRFVVSVAIGHPLFETPLP